MDNLPPEIGIPIAAILWTAVIMAWVRDYLERKRTK